MRAGRDIAARLHALDLLVDPGAARLFRDGLEEALSPDFADDTLRAVTEWGRYAELFAYDEAGDLFTLDDPG